MMKKNSIWMLPSYMEEIRETGAISITFPLIDNEGNMMCDGYGTRCVVFWRT